MERNKIDLSDEQLLLNLANGDRNSFSILIKRHTRRFYGLAYRMVSNKEEAEDIVQDCFVRLWENPLRWDAKKNTKFTTWFYRVVVNRCLDKKKKSKEITITDDYELSASSTDTEAIVNTRRMQLEIDEYITELPQAQQTALNLCFYEGVSNKEAAEVMGVSVKAVESLLMRAKSTLRAKMIKYYRKEVV